MPNNRIFLPPAWVMHVPNAMRNLFLHLGRALQPAGLSLFDMVLESYCTMAMAQAARLQIADHLLLGPKSIEDLAELTKSNLDALYRLLRTLCSNGIFKESKGRHFRNTRLSRALADIPGSMKHMVISHLGPTMLRTFAEIDHCTKTGQAAASKYLGQALFDHLASNSDEHQNFTMAMDEASRLSIAAILAVFNFKPYATIADIGGGMGAILSAILDTAPQSLGILFDRPETIAKAQNFLIGSLLKDRISTCAGDFFTDPLPQATIYILKNIIHDWDDVQAKKILDNIRQQAKPGCILILAEAVLPKGNGRDRGKMLDLLMLLGLDGARERTADEFSRLLAASGFKTMKLYKTVTPISLIVAEAL